MYRTSLSASIGYLYADLGEICTPPPKSLQGSANRLRLLSGYKTQSLDQGKRPRGELQLLNRGVGPCHKCPTKDPGKYRDVRPPRAPPPARHRLAPARCSQF